MSTRSQVKILNENHDAVFLYQHYDGYNLMTTVCRALRRRERWSDFEYLNRIIFSQMLIDGEAINDSTGYGIGLHQHLDIEYLIIVSIPNQEVTEFEGYGQFNPNNDNWKVLRSYKFSDIPEVVDEYKFDE